MPSAPNRVNGGAQKRSSIAVGTGWSLSEFRLRRTDRFPNSGWDGLVTVQIQVGINLILYLPSLPPNRTSSPPLCLVCLHTRRWMHCCEFTPSAVSAVDTNPRSCPSSAWETSRTFDSLHVDLQGQSSNAPFTASYHICSWEGQRMGRVGRKNVARMQGRRERVICSMKSTGRLDELRHDRMQELIRFAARATWGSIIDAVVCDKRYEFCPHI